MALALSREAVLRGAAAIAMGALAPSTIRAQARAQALFVDAHQHPPRGRVRDPGAPRRLLAPFGIDHAVIAPPPLLFDSPGRYSPEELKSETSGEPRLSFVAGGETLNPVLQATPAARVTADLIKRYVGQAERIARIGASGFGELAVEHFSANRGAHPYESSPADHPLLLALADVAAQERMPLEIHMEAVPQDMPFPPIPIRGGRNPDRLHANIPAFEALLAHNRDATIVWLHAGWDFTGERTPELMSRLLVAHPNLAMSVKIDPNGPRRTAPFNEDGEIKPGWLAMLRAHPDRFFAGSDQFADDPLDRLTAARRFVDALPEDLEPPIARDNARRLYHLS